MWTRAELSLAISYFHNLASRFFLWLISHYDPPKGGIFCWISRITWLDTCKFKTLGKTKAGANAVRILMLWRGLWNNSLLLNSRLSPAPKFVFVFLPVYLGQYTDTHCCECASEEHQCSSLVGPLTTYGSCGKDESSPYFLLDSL